MPKGASKPTGKEVLAKNHSVYNTMSFVSEYDLDGKLAARADELTGLVIWEDAPFTVESFKCFIGHNLAEARRRAGMTQQEAAAALTQRDETGAPVNPDAKEVSAQRIQAWETGKREPKASEFAALCHVYGTQPSRIMGFIDAETEELLDRLIAYREGGER